MNQKIARKRGYVLHVVQNCKTCVQKSMHSGVKLRDWNLSERSQSRMESTISDCLSDLYNSERAVKNKRRRERERVGMWRGVTRMEVGHPPSHMPW